MNRYLHSRITRISYDEQLKADMLKHMQSLEEREEILKRPFPIVSPEKETALLLIQAGLSYRKTAERLRMNHTIITQWSKNDHEFKRLLELVEREKQEAIRRNSLLALAIETEKTTISQDNVDLEETNN